MCNFAARSIANALESKSKNYNIKKMRSKFYVLLAALSVIVLPSCKTSEPEMKGDKDNVMGVSPKGLEPVDLGLPSQIKWANINLGATAPEEFGDYFSWAEVQPKKEYSWGTYKWCKGAQDTMTKYCTASFQGTVDHLTALLPGDDAANANWGNGWRVPGIDDFNELLNNCTWIWTTLGGNIGYRIVGPNGNSIFLPAAGSMEGTRLVNAGHVSGYWTDALYDDSNDAFVLSYHTTSLEMSSYQRYTGLSIRPVHN